MTDLNPQIKKIQIGVSELREIKIYPLSIYSQQKMGEEIQNVLKTFFEFKDEDSEEKKLEFELARMVTGVIRKNLGILLALATCVDDEAICSGEKENPDIKDLTNLQAIAIGDILYKQNYGEVLGKLKSLIPPETLVKLIANFSK